MIGDVFPAAGLGPPRAHVVSFSIPLHQHLLATGGFVTMLPMSMLHFGTHLSMKLLPVATIDKSYPIGIIALKNRTLAPFAQVFIGHALKIAQSMTKSG